MRLEWAPAALADRSAIFAYIESDNPRAAAALDERFMRATGRLRQFPHLGRPGRVPGTRELVIKRRYLVVYRLAGDTVQILALVHTSRQWPPLT